MAEPFSLYTERNVMSRKVAFTKANAERNTYALRNVLDILFKHPETGLRIHIHMLSQ